VLLVPGDCPSLDADEVRTLLAQTEPVVIVPDRHGTGTNALLLTPPDVMRPSFGEGSFARHAALAGEALCVVNIPSLGLDVDTPEDLAALRRAPGIGPRTRALLEQAAVA
jgi:2-phospho-L-lactate guanylyltransferase